MRTAAGVTFLHGDHLGSSNVATNASGVLLSRQTYYAFGAPRAYDIAPIANTTDYGFTGQKLDASDGQMYYNARYYDAALGRFISADTIVPQPFNPQSLNRYSYALNNPVRYLDPTGHCPIDPDTGGCERDANENVIFTVEQKEYGDPPPDRSLDNCRSANCWGKDPSESNSDNPALPESTRTPRPTSDPTPPRSRAPTPDPTKTGTPELPTPFPTPIPTTKPTPPALPDALQVEIQKQMWRKWQETHSNECFEFASCVYSDNNGGGFLGERGGDK